MISTHRTLQVRTEYGVLPADHPQRSGAQFVRVTSLIEGGSPTQAKQLLLEGDLAEDAAGQLYAGMQSVAWRAKRGARLSPAGLVVGGRR